MFNIENLSTVAMNVITYSGLAKSRYIEALRAFKRKDYKQYDELIRLGDEEFTTAHKAHASVLKEEMETGVPQITLLLSHAEDQLMATETIRTIIQEFVEIIKERC